MREAVQRCVRVASDLDLEQRVCWPNVDVRWLMVRGRAAQDESGRPVRVAGVSLDITERKRSDLLASGPAPDVAMHTQHVMQRQLQHMVRLIDDLLDVSRITQGRLDLQRERITLASAIEVALEATQPFIERWKHTLRVANDDRDLWLHADPTRIAQVISNLLHNASKYTAPRRRD